MPKIHIKAASAYTQYYNPNEAPPERRALGEVLGFDGGASKRGSTYHSKLLTCPREFALTYEAKLKPVVTAEQLTCGLIYHYAQETYYDSIAKHQMAMRASGKLNLLNKPTREKFFWGNARESQEKAFAAIECISKEPGYERTWSLIERILNFYFETYWKTDEWEVLATEYPVEIEVVGSVGATAKQKATYTTRLDQIVHDHKRNGVWVIEAKTARSITSDLLDNYQQDFQVLGEVFTFLNAVEIDLPFLGVNVCIVSKALQPKATRVEVMPSTQHMHEFKKTLLAFNTLVDVYKSLGWPKALGKCAGASRGYSKCTFYNVCHNFPEVEVGEWEDRNPPEGFEFGSITEEERL